MPYRVQVQKQHDFFNFSFFLSTPGRPGGTVGIHLPYGHLDHGFDFFSPTWANTPPLLGGQFPYPLASPSSSSLFPGGCDVILGCISDFSVLVTTTPSGSSFDFSIAEQCFNDSSASSSRPASRVHTANLYSHYATCTSSASSLTSLFARQHPTISLSSSSHPAS